MFITVVIALIHKKESMNISVCCLPRMEFLKTSLVSSGAQKLYSQP